MQHNSITLELFKKLDIRAGTIIKTEKFPEARKAAYKIWVDLGEEIGVKQSSARITGNYEVNSLVGKQVICVVNLPPRQIGPFMSEVLVTGFSDEKGEIVLAVAEQKVTDGARLH